MGPTQEPHALRIMLHECGKFPVVVISVTRFNDKLVVFKFLHRFHYVSNHVPISTSTFDGANTHSESSALGPNRQPSMATQQSFVIKLKVVSTQEQVLHPDLISQPATSIQTYDLPINHAWRVGRTPRWSQASPSKQDPKNRSLPILRAVQKTSISLNKKTASTPFFPLKGSQWTARARSNPSRFEDSLAFIYSKTVVRAIDTHSWSRTAHEV